MSSSSPDPVPSPAPASPAPKAKPPRSSVERFVVWGGIIALLVLVGIQARARFGYTMTLNALQARIAEDEGLDPQPLLVSEVDRLLVGWPKKTEETASAHRSLIHLSWRGLTTSYSMTLPYDPTETQPAIMGLETSDAPAEPDTSFAEIGSTPETGTPPGSSGPPPGAGHDAASGPGGPGGPGGGPTGQGGGRDPLANDADGDGKLSRDEAQGRIAENFDEIDADADGFLDVEEINAWREANPRPAADGDRPGRPAADDGDSTDSPTPPDSATETSESESPESATDSPESATESPESATESPESESATDSDPAAAPESESSETESSETP